ncbi:hypothetical protein [Aestuariivivens sediminicola]|uniref:hypothetical protein n=1 Tax=Aestuariivivens sediminicola TaxID=2913560 RepID=UPI001F5995A5|nr:hypothetical protein [Aestuariivivens sediminicola]
MTNLNKLYTIYDVQEPKEKEVLKDLLTNHLPKEYTAIVINRLRHNDVQVDSQSVRNTKCGISKNLVIFSTIIEIAQEYKQLSKKLKDNLNAV